MKIFWKKIGKNGFFFIIFTLNLIKKIPNSININCYVCISSARFWLGFDSNQKQKNSTRLDSTIFDSFPSLFLRHFVLIEIEWEVVNVKPKKSRSSIGKNLNIWPKKVYSSMYYCRISLAGKDEIDEVYNTLLYLCPLLQG